MYDSQRQEAQRTARLLYVMFQFTPLVYLLLGGFLVAGITWQSRAPFPDHRVVHWVLGGVVILLGLLGPRLAERLPMRPQAQKAPWQRFGPYAVALRRIVVRLTVAEVAAVIALVDVLLTGSLLVGGVLLLIAALSIALVRPQEDEFEQQPPAL